MLYVPLGFENGLTIDALSDSRAYINAITGIDWESIEQQAPTNTFKIDDPPNLEKKIANGRLVKPKATAPLKFDMGNHTSSS